jgi:hypothetical protein
MRYSKRNEATDTSPANLQSCNWRRHMRPAPSSNCCRHHQPHHESGKPAYLRGASRQGKTGHKESKYGKLRWHLYLCQHAVKGYTSWAPPFTVGELGEVRCLWQNRLQARARSRREKSSLCRLQMVLWLAAENELHCQTGGFSLPLGLVWSSSPGRSPAVPSGTSTSAPGAPPARHHNVWLRSRLLLGPPASSLIYVLALIQRCPTGIVHASFRNPLLLQGLQHRLQVW